MTDFFWSGVSTEILVFRTVTRQVLGRTVCAETSGTSGPGLPSVHRGLGRGPQVSDGAAGVRRWGLGRVLTGEHRGTRSVTRARWGVLAGCPANGGHLCPPRSSDLKCLHAGPEVPVPQLEVVPAVLQFSTPERRPPHLHWPLTHSFTSHSFTCSLTHSFTLLLILTHSLTHSFTHSLPQ